MVKEGLALVAEIGLWGWVGSMLLLIIQSFPEKNIFHAKKAANWGLLVVFFFCLWVFGMVKA